MLCAEAAFATDFAPHNMTGNMAPTPYVAAASSTYAGQTFPYHAFAPTGTYEWIGTGGGVDWLQLDLGGTLLSVHSMTSNSTPSPYVASASSSLNSNYQAYEAFNGLLQGNQFWIGTGGGTDWLELDLGSGNAAILNTYSIQSPSIGGEDLHQPKNWTMQGSNDNSTWTTVDTRTNQTSWGASQTRVYVCATQTTAYRYFRLNITANNGDPTYTDVGELSLYSSAANAKVLNSYAVQFDNNGDPVNRAPKNWTMQGSNDGKTWTTVDTQTNQTSWTAGMVRTYICGSPSATAFEFYRINITANNGDATYTAIDQLYLYEVAPVSGRHRLLIN
jgi:hypothetical protein